MDLEQRLIVLSNSLEGMGIPSVQTAEIFNVLLADAKEKHGDDPVVSALKPVGDDGLGNATETAASMGASVGQMLEAVRGN